MKEDPSMVHLDSLLDLKKRIEGQISSIQHKDDDLKMQYRYDKTKQYQLLKIIKN